MKIKEISVTMGRKDTINKDGGYFGKELIVSKTIDIDEDDDVKEVTRKVRKTIKDELDDYFNPFKE